MTRKWDDDDIEKAFAEWRGADANAAPPFDAMYDAARAQAAKPAATAPWRRTALAAAVLVAAAAGWVLVEPHAMQWRLGKAAPPTVSLSEWRSPTAFLLQGPSDLLVKTVPTFSATPVELDALGVRAAHRRHL